MKKILLPLFALLLCMNPLSYGQDQKVEIQNLLEEYLEHLKTKNATKTLDYIHPKLFDFAPRAMMEQAMEGMYGDETFSLEFHESKILNISDIVKEEDNAYAMIDYQFNMVMTFAKDNDAASMTVEILEGQYGEDNTHYDEENRVATITIKNQMYAIQEPATFEGWKVIENKANMAQILDVMIPKTIQEKLNP